MKKENEEVLIPDEFVPDFSLSKEEQEKRWKEHCKKGQESWKKILKEE